MKNDTVTMIAGPCSLNGENTAQLYDIGALTVPDRYGSMSQAIWGVRAVGLKSRTSLSARSADMGIDYEAYTHNLTHHMAGGDTSQFIVPPSLMIAREVADRTGLIVATEIVDPAMQLPLYARMFGPNELLVWNPAVAQLGYHSLVMGAYARRHGWFHGIKNGKWLGETQGKVSSLEKTWEGLESYGMGGDTEGGHEKLIMIHRGVDVAGKGAYRNLPVHEEAAHVKKRLGTRLFFDPSHTCGPRLRSRIVEETIKALRMVVDKDEYLYDGILIEVGDSLTDTEQHITLTELYELCSAVAQFRDLGGPK